ncbi:MAG: MFS transporter [Sciscionella sp.]
MLIATINSSIVLIALPDIFKGIHINPLDPSNTGYLLWMIMGFLVVTAVLVVGFGRLGDMYGRARMYNLGFAIFTVSSVLLAFTWMDGDAAALWLIAWRIVQGIGGAFLMANSSAILTDAFPSNQRGLALGINGVAAIAGSFIGLVIGGVLAPVNWHLVFLVSVPIGLIGTVWAFLKLHDVGSRTPARMDWWGNLTFAVGLIAVLVGITYGIQPYGGSTMGWGSPTVLICLIGGIMVLGLFTYVETRVGNPLFNLSLFKIRSFTAGNLANLLAALGRGGLQFILIIWLQGIWLPQHGYSFAETPLWAGIYMLPMTVGFLLSAPVSGVLSDRFGTRAFATVGMIIAAATFLLLILLPVNFNYLAFAAILLLNGIGMGLFASPNRAEVMNSLPAGARGAGAGMTATFQNAAMVLSIGIFFSLIITGLSSHLPSAMEHGLTAHGVPAVDAQHVAGLPPVAVLFAAFLGYNPTQQLLGPVLNGLPADQASFLAGRSFFPNLISEPFADGLAVAFWFAIVACLVAAVASWLIAPARSGTAVAGEHESVGAELASTAAESGTMPAEMVGSAAVPAGSGMNGPGGYAGNGAGQHNGISQGGGTIRQPVSESAVLDGAVPAGGGVIAGRVRTSGGRGVAAVALTLIDPVGRQIGRGVTEADGRYRMDVPAPGTYVLVAAEGMHQPQASTVMVGNGVVELDILLSSTVGLAGRVKAADTLVPVVGATTTLADGRGDVVAAAMTGADGDYAFTDLLSGSYTLVVSADAYRLAALAVTVPTSGQARQDVTLVGGSRLRGLAKTAGGGQLVPDVRITLLDGAGRVVGVTYTDHAGEYSFGDLDSGEYSVIACGYPPVASTLRVAVGQQGQHDVHLGHPEA